VLGNSIIGNTLCSKARFFRFPDDTKTEVAYLVSISLSFRHDAFLSPGGTSIKAD
jgi:hypothetical protein